MYHRSKSLCHAFAIAFLDILLGVARGSLLLLCKLLDIDIALNDAYTHATAPGL